LLDGAGVHPLQPVGSDPTIRGVALDSRAAVSGDLFFAIRGLRSDGETFVPQAVERGAVAIVAASPRPDWASGELAWVRVDEPRRAAGLLAREHFGRPDEAMTLIGVTGTNGKTTVVSLVEAIAHAAGRRAGRIGTVGYAFGGVEHPTKHTTPEAPELFRLLAEMRDAGVELTAMEVSSHALALRRVEGARFSVAAFLNLGRDHLDFHADREAYFEAKARMFRELSPDARAVISTDTSYHARLREAACAPVLGFGRADGADVRLRDEHCALQGSSAVLDLPSGPLPVRTFLLGPLNLENVAAAAACAVAAELPAESIASGVLALERVPGRMEPVDQGQPFAVIVDYAHTEDALRSLLDWLKSQTRGELRLVFGCGGDRDRGKREEMGRSAAERADRLYVTSDNPRGEDPLAIIDAVQRGVASVPGASGRSSAIPDRREAIRAAISSANAGDIVVVAGKGHETTQTIGDRVEELDDRLEAARALAETGYREVERA